MYNDILIFKNNSLLIEYYSNESKQKEVDEVDPDFFYTLYDCKVVFDEDLTVEGFLMALKPFIEIIESHFASYLEGVELKPYYKLLKRKPEKIKGTKSKIEYIEMYWVCEIFQFFDESLDKHISEFEKYGNYHGVSDDEGEFFGMGLTPLNDWKNYNLKLNPKLECYLNGEGVVQAKLFEAELQWSLHDAIRYFFYELTFLGSVEDSEAFREDMDKRIEEIRNGGAEGGKLYNLDDLKSEYELDTLTRQLNSAVEKEDYEIAQRLKEKIDRLNSENKNSKSKN